MNFLCFTIIFCCMYPLNNENLQLMTPCVMGNMFRDLKFHWNECEHKVGFMPIFISGIELWEEETWGLGWLTNGNWEYKFEPTWYIPYSTSCDIYTTLWLTSCVGIVGWNGMKEAGWIFSFNRRGGLSRKHTAILQCCLHDGLKISSGGNERWWRWCDSYGEWWWPYTQYNTWICQSTGFRMWSHKDSKALVSYPGWWQCLLTTLAHVCLAWEEDENVWQKKF